MIFDKINNFIYKGDTELKYSSMEQHANRHKEYLVEVKTTEFDPGSSNLREAVTLFQLTGNADKLQHYLIGILLN